MFSALWRGMWLVVVSVSALIAAEPITSGPLPMADGPAQPDLENLRGFECPAWFRDAKFGIRVQWGPQSVPELGDDYARNFSIPGRRAHEYHVANFGDPAAVGYQAVIARWTAAQFDPEALAKRFAAAGAKYVVALAADRDNVDLWASTHNPLNAVNHGPKRDIVAAWAAAVRGAGLRFGVSEHNAPGYDSRELNPQPSTAPGGAERWYARIHELADTARPDLLYTIGRPVPDDVNWRLLAHYYNRGLDWHDDLEVVYAARANTHPWIAGTGVETIERGVTAGIAAAPWQCDTPLNDWIYDREMPMRSATAVIHQLADVVSKNGNLLLNVPLRADGSLPDEAAAVLDEIGAWLEVNGQAIYGTRPWGPFGEGPTETVPGPLGEKQTLPYTPEDVRFTVKAPPPGLGLDMRETLYAIVLGWPGPGEEVVISALATGPKQRPIATVRLLGHRSALRMVRDRDGLHIQLPPDAPCRHAIVFRID